MQPRSSFVTALAWTFIALSGMSTAVALLQNVTLTLMMSPQEMAAAAGQAEGPQMPAFAKFMFGHFRLFFGLFLVVSAATLIAAIGLLKRKDWARLAFIGILGFAIAWNLVGVATPFFLFSSVELPADMPPDFRERFEVLVWIMSAFGVLVAVAFIGLFGWLIKRLLSSDIRQEFG